MDAGTASGIAIGVAAAACSEVPGIGTAACAVGAAIATAFKAIGMAITAAERDTFHPTNHQAEAWLTLFRLDPALTMQGVDNTGEPYQATHLVRYFRVLAGEVPTGKFGNNGVLDNPSKADTSNTYLTNGDSEEPLTQVATLQKVQSQLAAWAAAGSNVDNFAHYVKPIHDKPNDLKALLTLIRAYPAVFQDISTWDTFTANKAQIAEAIKAARIRAGESGADNVLSLIFGDVTVPERKGNGGKADPKMAGASCCASCSSHALAAGLAAMVPALDPKAMKAEEAKAWLDGFSKDPALLFEAADGSCAVPQTTALLRSLRSAAGLADDHADPSRPLLHPEILGPLAASTIGNSYSGESNRPPLTPDTARAYLALIRQHAETLPGIFGGETLARLRKDVAALRRAAGETGPDAALSALFGDVTVSDAMATTGPADPPMAGFVEDHPIITGGAKVATGLAIVGALVGGWYAYPIVFPSKPHKRS